MSRFILMFILGLAALVLVPHAAEAKGVKLTKEQVLTVCNGKTNCQKYCGVTGDDLCQFKCKGGQCEGKCTTCGVVQESRHIFPNLYSKHVVRQAVRRAP